MEKTCNNATRLTKVKVMINNGATWEEVEEKFGVTRTYLQKLLRQAYRTPTAYNTLLAKARENEAKKREAECANTVIVTETGALIRHTQSVIKRGEKMKICVPEFCRNEIRKVERETGEEYNKVLNNKKISWCSRDGQVEILPVFPKKNIKPRSIGIVYLCCRMIEEGFKVILKTNSYQVATLAEMQNLGIKVVKL